MGNAWELTGWVRITEPDGSIDYRIPEQSIAAAGERRMEFETLLRAAAPGSQRQRNLYKITCQFHKCGSGSKSLADYEALVRLIYTWDTVDSFDHSTAEVVPRYPERSSGLGPASSLLL